MKHFYELEIGEKFKFAADEPILYTRVSVEGDAGRCRYFDPSTGEVKFVSQNAGVKVRYTRTQTYEVWE